MAGCVGPPYPSYYATEQCSIQVKAVWGVNKSFYRAWDEGILELDCPGYPTQAYYRFYEGLEPIAGRDPILEVGGYMAVCALAGTFKGSSYWLWAAVLNYVPFGGPPYPIRQAHIQYKNTNAGSIGLVRYPLSPV